jgi:hypothetical protein
VCFVIHERMAALIPVKALVSLDQLNLSTEF